MNGHLIQIAREQLKDSMADMKGFTNKLLIIIVSLFFVSMISFVNNSLIREASGEPTPIIFFDVPIHKEYISFIYGVLYLVYIVGLFIKIRQFGYDVNEVQEKGLGDQVFDTVTLYHWSISPFHRAKSALLIFVAILCIMSIHLVVLSNGHLVNVDTVSITPNFPKFLYSGIGVFDVVVLFIFAILGYRIIKEITILRQKLGA